MCGVGDRPGHCLFHKSLQDDVNIHFQLFEVEIESSVFLVLISLVLVPWFLSLVFRSKQCKLVKIAI